MSTGGGAEFRFVFVDEGGGDAPAAEPRPGGASRARAENGREERESGRGPRRERSGLPTGTGSSDRTPAQGIADLAGQVSSAIGNVPVLGRMAQASESLIRPILATAGALDALRTAITATVHRGPGSASTTPDMPRPMTPGAAAANRPTVTAPPVQTPPPIPTNTNFIGPPKAPPIQAPPIVPRAPAAAPTIPVQAGAAAGARLPVPAAGGGGGAAAGAGALASGGALAATVAIGAVVLAIGGTVAAFRALIARSNELKESLAGYSGVLAASKARAEAAKVQQDFSRAQFLGGDLANYNDASARIGRSVDRILDVFTKVGLERFAPLLDRLADIADLTAGYTEASLQKLQFLASLFGGGIIEKWANEAKEDRKEMLLTAKQQLEQLVKDDPGLLAIFQNQPELQADDKVVAGDIRRENVRFGAIGGPQLQVK